MYTLARLISALGTEKPMCWGERKQEKADLILLLFYSPSPSLLLFLLLLSSCKPTHFILIDVKCWNQFVGSGGPEALKSNVKTSLNPSSFLHGRCHKKQMNFNRTMRQHKEAYFQPPPLSVNGTLRELMCIKC